jgi:hypothetical protein
LATLPRAAKLSPSDTLLPTTPLTDSYTLTWVFAALYSNSTLSLNSVSGSKVDLAHATAQTNPTIVLAGPQTIKAYIEHPSTKHPGAIGKFTTGRSLSQGLMPSKAASSTPLSHLRVLLIPQSTTLPRSSRLSSKTLHTLRTMLKTRIGYALTAPQVAGSVTQTNIFDYRDKGNAVVVGAPVSSVEINLAGDEEGMGRRSPRGTVCRAFLVLSLFLLRWRGNRSHSDLDLDLDLDCSDGWRPVLQLAVPKWFVWPTRDFFWLTRQSIGNYGLCFSGKHASANLQSVTSRSYLQVRRTRCHDLTSQRCPTEIVLTGSLVTALLALVDAFSQWRPRPLNHHPTSTRLLAP